MQEFSVPAAYIVKPDDNVTDDVFTHARDWPDAAGFRRKVNGSWAPVTWREFAEEVRVIAAGLIAAGIGPGDRVALMSHTRFEWTLLDYAILTAGGITVPIYPTSSLEQVEWILGDSGAVAVVAETDDHAEKVAVARAGLPALAHVWEIDGSRFDGLADIKARGARVTAEQIEERRRTRGADDLAEIVYTSGTTGRPKGCMLSHGNIVANVRNCMLNDGFKRVFSEHHSTLLFLPLSHSYAQLIQYGAVYSRTVLGLADMADAVAELPAYKPTAVLSVPRLWEKAYNSARHKAAAEGHGKIFARAEATAIAYSQALEDGRPALNLRLKHALYDRLVYAKLRAALGGQVQYSWSAAAPLSTRLGHFFRGCGINVLEGYGLTETSPATNSNTPDAQKIGTVGRPIPGCTIRIAPDGEVLVKGHMVFQGYWNDDSATKEMIDEDGWLHTGDIGVLDDEGFLAITGRKKDLIITASGKNVAPAVLEDRLRAHWLISQCLIVGDARPYIGALVAVDPETFAQWKADNGKPRAAAMADLRDDPALQAEIQTAIDDANKAVSQAEAIKKFAILDEDFTEAGGQLTPTLKMRRYVIVEQYAAQIAALYDDGAS
ncbi:MAG TPA: long-chain fatty acid--CoA ligase [Streptosporangiaceae bacterium]|nr:long-chain fatty acid--CoA ligase [Streptosporangiaceae bacterium]